MDFQAEFLEAIWGSEAGYGEFRGIGLPEVNGDALPYQAWVDLDSFDARSQFAAAIDLAGRDNRDVYFGVIPRIRHGGDAASVFPTTDVLWADVDAKMHDYSKNKAMSALNKIAPEPSIIVDSGGGYHAYWLLRSDIPTFAATNLMKGIAAACGGDHTYDAPRILRVPGTVNHKYPSLPEARILKMSTTRRYPLGDFDAYLPEERVVVDPRERPAVALPVPSWLDELINTHFQKGTRSEAAFKAALWLWRYGYSEQEIEDIFDQAPIGESYREKGKDGHRWLTRMISKFD
jgi:hypothetical protein